MAKSLLILFFFLPSLLFSQKINFEFDYAQFAFDTLSNYVEFYYSFEQSSLTYIDTDSSDYVGGILHIQITDSASAEVLVDKQWMVNSEISDASELNKNLIGALGFILEKGSYIATVTGLDANNNDNLRTINELIIVEPFKGLDIAISDIQLSSNIIPGSENTSSIFYKNTYEVTPLPAALCGENQLVLFYYLEIYKHSLYQLQPCHQLIY